MSFAQSGWAIQHIVTSSHKLLAKPLQFHKGSVLKFNAFKQ